ncbi:DinB family protein [Kribbella amoyensis]|uniref:DinB family protein n=1 Tax=Kribbella amoyensis TaxID=996641 RepID=A0A561BXE7_9ACTN|nr:DinB family protein [Kribbella amoyensis]TWD83566.1 DinB family protein [Kribbella amoyensis]
MECGDLLIGQLEFYWDYHLRPRLDGLTDDEYQWAPAQPSWTVHEDGTGQAVFDLEYPEPTPPPVPTIAWRLVHIGVGCFAIRWSTFFGDGNVPADADMFDPRHRPTDLPLTATDGLAFLDHWYERWHDAIRGLDEQALWKPLGPKGGQYADDPMLALITHLNREVMHHGAEICLLRDLYRAGAAR